MSYKDDIKILRTLLKELGYREVPKILDLESEDFSTAFKDMGYTLKPYSVDGDDLTVGSQVGGRFYRLQVTYKAINQIEYDNVWDKFETLYRKIHEKCKYVESNNLDKYQDNQYQYIGVLEFNYGTRIC